MPSRLPDPRSHPQLHPNSRGGHCRTGATTPPGGAVAQAPHILLPTFTGPLVASLLIAMSAATLPAVEVWRLDRLDRIGGHATTVIGGAQVVRENGAKAVRFDGVDDGLLVHDNPLEDLAAFTIEVLLSSAPDGRPAQRFAHFQQNSDPNTRVMVETRLTPEGQWYLDTALLSRAASLVLKDPTKLHPPNRWTWVALRYDGRTMSHFVNGVKELEGEVKFAPMKAGQTTLGVRQNLVSWFKGAIREVRIHDAALPEQKLARISRP